MSQVGPRPQILCGPGLPSPLPPRPYSHVSFPGIEGRSVNLSRLTRGPVRMPRRTGPKLWRPAGLGATPPPAPASCDLSKLSNSPRPFSERNVSSVEWVENINRGRLCAGADEWARPPSLLQGGLTH